MSLDLRPAQLDEALAVLGDGGRETEAVAGGLTVLRRLGAGEQRRQRYVSLARLSELRGIREEGDAVLVGAMCSVRELLESSSVAQSAPLLAEACRRVSSPAIRNQATIGGNIVAADPSHDLIPTLMALDAVALIVSASGRRTASLAEVVEGAGAHTPGLAPGELLASISVPVSPRGWAYHTFSTQGMQDRNSASVAVAIDMIGERARSVRAVVCAVSRIPVRLLELERHALGRSDDGPLSRAALTELFDAATEDLAQADVFDDERGAAWFRRRVAAVLAARAVAEAIGRCK